MGDIGVVSKEYIPSIDLNADRQGLRVHVSIMFKGMSHSSVILHQFSMRKEGGTPALTAMKWFFHMRQHRFVNVGKMDVSRCVLNLGLLLRYEGSYVLGFFVVHLVQLWLVTTHS